MRRGVLLGALLLPLAAPAQSAGVRLPEKTTVAHRAFGAERLAAAAAPPIPANFPPSSKALPPPTASAAPSASPSPPPKPLDPIGALLTGALPTDGATDVVLIDWPAVPGSPHVRAATVVRAAPAAIKSVLLDAANYKKIVPALIRADVARTKAGLPSVEWEVEVPLFNLTGTLVIHERPDGADIDLVEGDFSPGKLSFTATPRPAGGSTLLVDAQLNIKNAGWLIRKLVNLSPAGEPAALVAASYVTVRAVGLRAENAGSGGARRPGATPAPPPVWSPSARALADEKLAALRAHGAVALVGRTWSQRLAGVAVATTVGVPTPNALGRLRDPESWHAFPGWRTVERRQGPNGIGAKVEDNLPFVDLEATWAAEPGDPLRWTATDGVITGARLGWEIYPIDPRANAGAPTLMALMMYPRLETTGRLARKAIASEPLLEHGLAVAVAFADLTAMKTALESTH
ncbi:MAG TPA: hypothetical protein VN903_22585 [Polyangia bacterium]|jgi:hypothetical protein|nr:hypothetical protein [Polyangia bacterium]